VWESWEVIIRDLFVLNRDGNVVEVVNLTSFNPDPSENDGDNYLTIKNLLLEARDQ
jgi:peroxiredoxin